MTDIHMTDCPSLDELADFTKSGDDLAVDQHLSGCRRCRALLRLLDQRELVVADELNAGDVPQASLPRRASQDGDLTFGEVCVIDTEDSDGTLLVAVVLDGADEARETVEVAPVS